MHQETMQHNARKSKALPLNSKSVSCLLALTISQLNRHSSI